jgi:hypothetical protein
MEPTILHQVASGPTNNLYHQIGVILAYCGSAISFIGIVWKAASLMLYFRNLYKELVKRIDDLEKEKCIDDVHLEVIKNMAQDLSGVVKQHSDEFGDKIREVHKRIDDYMMNECNRRKEDTPVKTERRKDGN